MSRRSFWTRRSRSLRIGIAVIVVSVVAVAVRFCVQSAFDYRDYSRLEPGSARRVHDLLMSGEIVRHATVADLVGWNLEEWRRVRRQGILPDFPGILHPARRFDLRAVSELGVDGDGAVAFRVYWFCGAASDPQVWIYSLDDAIIAVRGSQLVGHGAFDEVWRVVDADRLEQFVRRAESIAVQSSDAETR